MSEYKKEAPKLDPWDGIVTSSQRIQHYCALIECSVLELKHYEDWSKEDKEQFLTDIVHFTRSIWDLVPEEEIVQCPNCRKENNQLMFVCFNCDEKWSK